MLHVIKIVIIRLAVMTTASAGFAYVLLAIHEFPQTRQAYYSYLSGDQRLWLLPFYFVNEAGSGIKYALTGDQRYLEYFPREPSEPDAQSTFHTDLFLAEQGDWEAQLRLSHILALGWGIRQDKSHAVDWYLRSKQVAQSSDESDAWLASHRRKQISAYLNEEIELRLLQQELIQPQTREDPDRQLESQQIGGSRI